MPESPDMDTQYDPKTVEATWYDVWMREGYFRPSCSPCKPDSPHTHNTATSSDAPFVLTIPPPNVTGDLHMGHALQHSVHDILVRWHRMQGRETLCIPGMDHASIPVQMLVERQLRQEGVSRLDLGRDGFLERAWRWKERYGGEILKQLRRLGCSYDWSRERFTMDPGYTKAVLTAFAIYHERGWVYRGSRVINWCTSCQTALSDLEVYYEEADGFIYKIDYPLSDGSGALTVATTRPETMLGDTAVAVHPDDTRYAGSIGKSIVLPLVGREIPVVGDAILVDPTFGSGAVKVTPAHDLNDFESGLRNHLPQEVVIDKHGRMRLSHLIEIYGAERLRAMDGTTIAECREAVIEELRACGRIQETEPYHHSVAKCERCHTVIEPLLSEQWFVRMKELAKLAVDAVRSDRVRFVPERHEKVFLDWMENIRDWCVSRQVWWGHRMPVWHCSDCEAIKVSVDRPESCQACSGRTIVQDENTLDTWFSSALWTFATMGWPEKAPDLERYHPTSLLITDRQIINLWVARMIYSSLAFLDQVPFREVYIHATVLDRHGQRMSKTKGNVVNPLTLIDTYGTDATRFGLISMAAKGQDIRFSDEKIIAARNFCNKLWNAARFVLLNVDSTNGALPTPTLLADRWILSRLHRTIEQTNASLTEYDFSEAARALYEFAWGDFCDWYVEISKRRLAAGDSTARGVLLHVLETTLRLLHPFVPFVTEEIWQRVRPLVDADGVRHLIGARWPRVTGGGGAIGATSGTESEETAAVAEGFGADAGIGGGAGDSRGKGTSAAAAVATVSASVVTGSGGAAFDGEAEAQMSLLQGVITAIRSVRGEMSIPPQERTEVLIRAIDDKHAEVLRDNAEIIADLTRASAVKIASGLLRPRHSAGTVVQGNDVWLPLDGVIDIEAEVARFAREADKLEGLIRGLEGRLADPAFLERAPALVVEQQRQKMAAHRQTLDRIEANLAVLEE